MQRHLVEDIRVLLLLSDWLISTCSNYQGYLESKLLLSPLFYLLRLVLSREQLPQYIHQLSTEVWSLKREYPQGVLRFPSENTDFAQVDEVIGERVDALSNPWVET